MQVIHSGYLLSLMPSNFDEQGSVGVLLIKASKII